MDEKPSIQALERAQGYLKLTKGLALRGHSPINTMAGHPRRPRDPQYSQTEK